MGRKELYKELKWDLECPDKSISHLRRLRNTGDSDVLEKVKNTNAKTKVTPGI